jgi:3',5'-cyclic-AMP phosphodiesterase
MIRVTQFSDTHFSTKGRSHGGFGYDTDETWETIYAHAFERGEPVPDLVVVSGDIADHGLADEYAKAAAAFERLPVAANVCAGNHDFHVPLEAVLPRPRLTMSRTMRVGPWLFLFADSNHNGREIGDDGRLHDLEDRIEEKAQFGPQEVAWLSETINATDADHAFIWVHHPPQAPGFFNSSIHDSEVEDLFCTHTKLRGLGAGHTHTNTSAEIHGRHAYVCPSFTLNVDFVEHTTLPPGYRTYEFHDDGTVASVCHLLDDERWPRRKLPAPTVAWLMGEISYDEMIAQVEAVRRTKS